MKLRGYIFFGVLLLIASSCGQDESLPPYRGKFLRNVKIGEALTNYLVERKGFKPDQNCVQMVARDKIEDRVRKIQKLVIFSPDPCPKEGKVADREAFAVQFVETPIEDGAALPARAYFLVDHSVVVGDIELQEKSVEGTTEGDTETKPGSEVEEKPGAEVVFPEEDRVIFPGDEGEETEEGTEGETATETPKEYVLTSLCALETDNYIKDNCDVEISHDGFFSQVNLNLAAVSRLSREQALSNFIVDRFDYMDRLIQAVQSNLAAGQQTIIQDIQRSTELLRSEILRNRSVISALLVDEIRKQFQDLNSRNNTAFQTMSRNFQRQLQEVERNIIRTLRMEIRTEAGKTREFLRRVRNDLRGRLNTVRTRILNELDSVEDTLSNRIDRSERRLSNRIATVVTKLNNIKRDLRLIEGRLKDRIDARSKQEIEAFERIVRRYTRQLTKYIKQQLKQQKNDVRDMLDRMERRLQGRVQDLADKVGEIRPQINKQLEALTKSIKNDNVEQAKRVVNDLTKLLNTIKKDLGDDISESEEETIKQFKKLLDEYNKQLVEKLRGDIQKAMGEVKTAVGNVKTTLTQRLDTLKQQIATAAGDAKTRLEAQKKQLEEAIKLSNELKKQIETAEKNLMSNDEKRWQKVSTVLARIEKSLGSLEQDLNQLDVQDEAVLGQIRELRRLIQQNAEEIQKDLRKEISASKKALKNLGDRVNAPASTVISNLFKEIQKQLNKQDEITSFGDSGRLLQLQIAALLDQSAALRIPAVDKGHLEALIELIDLYESSLSQSIRRNLHQYSLSILGQNNREADFGRLKQLIQNHRGTSFSNTAARGQIKTLLDNLTKLPGNRLGQNLSADLVLFASYLGQAEASLYGMKSQYLAALVDVRRNLTPGWSVPLQTAPLAMAPLGAAQMAVVAKLNTLITDVGTAIAKKDNATAKTKAGELKTFVESAEFKGLLDLLWAGQQSPEQKARFDSAVAKISQLTDTVGN